MQEQISPRLQQLQAAIAQGDAQALPHFWQELAQQGTPLIERLDAHDCLVTFVWRADERTHNVAVIQDWGTDGIREHHMKVLPGTDIWYKTRRMRSDTRTTYQLSPSSSTNPEEMGSYQTDPLNFHTHTAYLAEPGAGSNIVFSLLELPDAPQQPWLTADVPAGQVTGHQPANDGRRAWVYTPPQPNAGPYPLLLTFDGRAYKEMLQLPRILDWLIAERRIPPLIALLLDNPQRDQELPCNPTFVDYLVTRILPWLRDNYPVTQEPMQTVVTGSSFGGLAAVYCGLRYPSIFGKILSQTGWFRWRPEGDAEFEWLARQFVTAPLLPLRVYLDVGNLEVARMADNGPNQVTVNRHLRDVLQAKGYPVRYVEYSGGHDYSSLAYPLTEALSWAFGN